MCLYNMIRGKVGNKIPTWCDACGPWNFVTEMALKMNTFEMTRPGNQIADREVSKAKSCPDSLYHKQLPKSWPHTQGSISQYSSPFKHTVKDLSCLIVLFDAYMTTRYPNLKQMTRNFAYEVGNSSVLYCKQIITWRLQLRDPAVIMETSISKLWLASALNQKLTYRGNGEAACPT